MGRTTVLGPPRRIQRGARPARRRKVRAASRGLTLSQERRGPSGTFAATGDVIVLGILRIAYKLLVNDKGKFAALLMGITFSVFLMIQMTSMFAGMMKKASATVTNTGAKVWVMDRAVTNVSSAIPMPDYVLDAVRSIDGRQVRRAALLGRQRSCGSRTAPTSRSPCSASTTRASSAGRELIEGNIEDIYAENGFVVVKDEEFAEAREPEDRHRVRDQRQPRRHRRHRQGAGERALRHADALHDVQPRRSVHPVDALHDLVHPRRAAEPPRPSRTSRRRSRDSATRTVTEQGFIDKITNWYMFKHRAWGRTSCS